MSDPAAVAREGRPTGLVHVVWELTLRCDLACGHCGSRAGKARADELSTAEALRVVDELAAMGAQEVSLIGGEAYLRDDWLAIARAVRGAGMLCTMVTGGRGFTEERAAAAREAGIDSISVSIDGLEEAHDRQRGVRGSFAAARASLANLRSAGVAISLNSQVNRLSLPDLDGILDLGIEHGVHGWQVALTVPMGRATERPEWLLQPDDVLEVAPKLAALAERGRGAGVRLWPGNNVGYFGPHEETLRGRLVPGAHYQGCQAGRHGLGLEADGTVKGCPSLPTAAYAGGNVRERPIRAIWDEATELRFARDEHAAGGSEALWGYCAECYYASVCRGGCSWTAHVFFGRRGNNPYCHHRALEFAARGLRERLVQVERGSGAPFDHGRFALVVEPAAADRPGAGPRRLPLAPP